MEKMRAVIYEQYGLPDVLHLREVDKPLPKYDEVLIKVYAASLNSWDWDLLTGRPLEYRLSSGVLKPKTTHILGCDIAGRVEAVGDNITQFRKGDEVFGDLSGGSWGGFAEYVCVCENEIRLKPDSMTFEEAAAMPQAGLLALQGLCDSYQIKPGQKILINGAGGGVGTFGVQIAKSFGAEVTGVDSNSKLEMVSSLGADHVIDYNRNDFTKMGRVYDLILDVQTDRSLFAYGNVLSSQGRYVTVGGKTSRILQLLLVGSLLSKLREKSFAVVFHKQNKGLEVLVQLFKSGKIKPVIDRCFPLHETNEAFRYYGEGSFKGKIIIRVDENMEVEI